MRFIGSAIESDLTALRPGPIGSGTCFEGDLLYRMDENRRADFDRRPFLLHLNQEDGASM
jgi:hypothetical protein